jgi:hypothetical protein
MAGRVSQAAQELIPVHNGHVQVEKDEIGRTPEVLECIKTIDRRFDAIALVA